MPKAKKNIAPPKVLKVRDPPKEKGIKEIHPYLPECPSLQIIAGSVRQGKSNLLLNYLLNENFYGPTYYDETKIISNTINLDPKGRFLKEAFDVEDHYDDSMITGLLEKQKSYGLKEDMPRVGLFLDDIINKDFKKTNNVSFLASRFRHYHIDTLCFLVQSFRAIAPMIRSNATDVIVMKQQSDKEFEKISEEYSDCYGGPDNFRKMYNIAIEDEPFSFMYLRLNANPAEAYVRHEIPLAIKDKILYQGKGKSKTIEQSESEED